MFDNLITDYGISKAGDTTYYPLGICLVGTGTTTPTVNDINLDQYLNQTRETGDTVYSIENNKLAEVRKYTFTKGSVVGNITEVGVANGYGSITVSNQNLVSRTLITDSNNVPLALTVTSLDELTVYYKFLYSVSMNDTPVYVFTNNGVNHNVKLRRVCKHLPALNGNYGYFGGLS